MSNAEVEKISISSSSSSSTTNSLSLIKLDELSAFGATKNGRLPALIKLNTQEQMQDQQRQTHSMPVESVEQLERQQVAQQQQASLPVQSDPKQQQQDEDDKENSAESDGFQMVGMMGPSLPQPRVLDEEQKQQQQEQQEQGQTIHKTLGNSTNSILQQQPSHLGDSLIEMIVSLRNENQNLVRALETNNEYVKERISEFKRLSEESRKQEARFALEKADFEHQTRKLQRQNLVLSERLKSMEAKLKEMRLEVGDSLAAAASSKNSSVQGEQQQLYPDLSDEPDSFPIAEEPHTLGADQASTMQVEQSGPSVSAPSAPMDTSIPAPPTGSATAAQVSGMSREQLAARFVPEKSQFYALDDPMKQCDQLEQQLNDIGKRDYEICLLQQQLNIYRQDFRLERMANLEAKLQIERLKNDIDRLCFERLQGISAQTEPKETQTGGSSGRRAGHHHRSHSVRFDPSAVAGEALGRLNQSLNKRAAKQAAKAAKHAAKLAHREEKAASKATSSDEKLTDDEQRQPNYRRHHAYPPKGIRAVRSEVMNDLLSTANKAMLTGYKMASTHVNLALDKLSQFEQAQASNLANAKTTSNTEQPKAKPSGPPSVD